MITALIVLQAIVDAAVFFCLFKLMDVATVVMDTMIADKKRSIERDLIQPKIHSCL